MISITSIPAPWMVRTADSRPAPGPLTYTFTLRLSLIHIMEFTEQMLERVAVAVNGTTELTLDGKQISFKAPFRRLTMTDAIREKTGYDITGQSEEQLREACKRLGVEIDDTMGKGKLIDAIFGQYCEEELIQMCIRDRGCPSCGSNPPHGANPRRRAIRGRPTSHRPYPPP